MLIIIKKLRVKNSVSQDVMKEACALPEDYSTCGTVQHSTGLALPSLLYSNLCPTLSLVQTEKNLKVTR